MSGPDRAPDSVLNGPESQEPPPGGLPDDLTIPGCPQLSETLQVLRAAAGPLARDRLCALLDTEPDALRMRLVRLEQALMEVYPDLELVVTPGKKGWRGGPGAVELRRRPGPKKRHVR